MLALGSCTNEIHEEGFVDKSNAISFNTYTPKSRAVNSDVTSDNMKRDNFGVAGYTASDNDIYLYKGTTSGVEQTWDASAGAGSWEYANMADLKFWPNSAMNFYAYFPYSDNATFASNDASGNVMTISGVNCSHDVLFASALSQSKPERVPLTFHHAFSKIKGVQIEMPADGTVSKSKCQIQVKDVTFINTATSGDIKVNNTGDATYSVSAAAKPLTLTPSITEVTINGSNAAATPYSLIDNGDAAKGYLFATNSTTESHVQGTGKTFWVGTSLGSSTIAASELVCLKLTCKVWNGADEKKYYYVGNDASYGDIYIPLTGTHASSDPNDANTTAFLAGKRYTYKIVMKDNVGFNENGDPILNPILFSVDGVDSWDDVTVTITL